MRKLDDSYVGLQTYNAFDHRNIILKLNLITNCDLGHKKQNPLPHKVKGVSKSAR